MHQLHWQYHQEGIFPHHDKQLYQIQKNLSEDQRIQYSVTRQVPWQFVERESRHLASARRALCPPDKLNPFSPTKAISPPIILEISKSKEQARKTSEYLFPSKSKKIELNSDSSINLQICISMVQAYKISSPRTLSLTRRMGTLKMQNWELTTRCNWNLSKQILIVLSKCKERDLLGSYSLPNKMLSRTVPERIQATWKTGKLCDHECYITHQILTAVCLHLRNICYRTIAVHRSVD